MNLYLRRKNKEQHYITSSVITPRDKGFISGNMKTGYSLNFPISNCRPTTTCSQNCYACSGPIAFKNSILKALSIEQQLGQDLPLAVRETAKEIKRLKLDNLRYSGGGDLSDSGVEYIKQLANALPEVIFWGFTRKVDVAEQLINSNKLNIKVIFSLDKTTPSSILTKVANLKLNTSWLYDDSNNPPPRDVYVTFANHANGRLDKTLTKLAGECPAIHDHSVHCDECRHCFNFQ